MRGWWILALALACTDTHLSAPSSAIDAGDEPVPNNFKLSVNASRFALVRGESIQVSFAITGADARRAISLGAVHLPDGVTSAPVILNGATSGILTFTASLDATIGDAEIVVVTQASSLQGSTTFTLAVTAVDGSIDPTFAQNGFLTLDHFDAAHLRNINGKMLVIGSKSGYVHLARFNVDGSADVSFGVEGAVDYATTLEIMSGTSTVCDDGRVVVAAEISITPIDGGVTYEQHALVFEVNGAFLADVILPIDSYTTSVACGGGAIVFGADNAVTSLDSSLSPSTTITLPYDDYAAFVVVSPPYVYVGGESLFALDAASFAIDSSFGTIASVESVSLALDPSGRLVVGLMAPGVERVLASGGLDASFGKNGVAAIDFGQASTPLGALAIGPSSELFAIAALPGAGILITRLDENGNQVTTFGENGISFTDTNSQNVIWDTAFDSNGALWILGAAIPNDGSSFIARFRIESP